MLLVMERQHCVQICNTCLCWYWKDNVVFKFVINICLLYWEDNAVFKFWFMSALVMERQRCVQVCSACLLVLDRQRCCVQVCYSCLRWYWKDNIVFKFVMHIRFDGTRNSAVQRRLWNQIHVSEFRYRGSLNYDTFNCVVQFRHSLKQFGT